MAFEACGMGFGSGLFGWMLMLIFWGVIIWLVVWLVCQSSGKNANHKAILKSRYAKGEITKKQYNEMKKELEGSE